MIKTGVRRAITVLAHAFGGMGALYGGYGSWHGHHV